MRAQEHAAEALVLAECVDEADGDPGIEGRRHGSAAGQRPVDPVLDPGVLRSAAPPAAPFQAQDLAGRDVDAGEAGQRAGVLLLIGEGVDGAPELVERLEDLVVGASPR
nr:hypothetical protein [Catenulispora pinisilvae]